MTVVKKMYKKVHNMYMYKQNKNTFITQLDAHQNNTRLIFLLLKLINNSQRKFKRNQYLITIIILENERKITAKFS